MSIIVNGVEISPAKIEAEMPRHHDARSPFAAAAHELILRELLLQQAALLGVAGEDEDKRIHAVIAAQCPVGEVAGQACEAFYQSNPEKFSSGDMVAASHILFDPRDARQEGEVEALAQQVLNALKQAPQRFAELAQQHSACPSAGDGGSLGTLRRGETVPEFDAAIFSLEAGQMADGLVATDFGLHIIRVDSREPGRTVPYAMVKDQIAQFLQHQAQSQALNRYLETLQEAADIQGFDLASADPLWLA